MTDAADAALPALLTRTGRAAAELWPDSGLLHLNHGSYGRVPIAATDHQQRLQREMEAAPMRFMAAAPAGIAQARERIARFLRTDPDRLALVPNASAGVSTALRSLPLPAGSEVVLTDHTYGAVRMGVERAAREAGAHVRTVHVPLAAGDDEAAEAIWAGVTERTAMLVLDHVTSVTARRMPVGTVCARARERGILTIVDGAHAPLLLTDPVSEADADVWVGNLHKFASTPRGTAVLVAHPDVAQRLVPLIDSWGAPDPFPRRFDWQASADYTAWLTAPVSLQHLEDEIGWDRVRDHATAAAAHAVDRIGAALAERWGEDTAVDLGMPVGPIRLLALPAAVTTDATALRRRLGDAGIEAQITAFGDQHYWRLAMHAYSTAEDVDAAIERALPLLAAA